MMHFLTSSITLAAFLVHALWGCYVHHAHAYELPARDAATISHGDAAAHRGGSHAHCSHAAAAAHEECGDEPCEEGRHSDHECDEPGCSFKTQSRVQLPLFDFASGFESIAAVSVVAALPRRGDLLEAGGPLGAHTSAGARLLLQTWRL